MRQDKGGFMLHVRFSHRECCDLQPWSLLLHGQGPCPTFWAMTAQRDTLSSDVLERLICVTIFQSKSLISSEDSLLQISP